MLGLVHKKILDFLRTNAVLTRFIWGIRVHKRIIPPTWDVTTLCLKKAIDSRISETSFRFLDMGCGHLALLGQYVKKTFADAEVLSVDIYPSFAENAQLNVEANGYRVIVKHSNLFDDVDGTFDLMTFNPPYKPEISGDPGEFPLTRFSGVDGFDASRHFLEQAKQRLNKNGKIFLGINCFFLPQSRCVEVIEQCGYQVTEIISAPMNTSRVFVASLTD